MDLPAPVAPFILPGASLVMRPMGTANGAGKPGSDLDRLADITAEIGLAAPRRPIGPGSVKIE